MKLKLLSENMNKEKPKEIISEELTEKEYVDNGLSAMLSDLIQDELQAIDGYNSAIVTFADNNRDEYKEVFEDIIAEEQKHIGQLQKVLNEIKPGTTENIDDGEKEAEEQLAETQFPLDEDFDNNYKYVVVSKEEKESDPETEEVIDEFNNFDEAFKCATNKMDEFIKEISNVESDPGVYILKVADDEDSDEVTIVWNSNYGMGIYDLDDPFGKPLFHEPLSEEYKQGDEKILYPQSPEYDRLKQVAEILTTQSPNKYKYEVEDTYLDFGQKWMWTTIIVDRGPDETPVQILSPKEWLDIVNCDDESKLPDLIEKMKQDEYWVDKEIIEEGDKE